MYHRFHVPSTGNAVFWYAFGSHSVWMVVISAEHSLEAGSPQRTWLEAQLKAVNRTEYPWLIVNSHR